jgi:hypothetical protein
VQQKHVQVLALQVFEGLFGRPNNVFLAVVVVFDGIGAGFGHVLNTAFRYQLNLFAGNPTLFEGGAKLGFGSIAAINIGVIKGGDLVFEADVLSFLSQAPQFMVPAIIGESDDLLIINKN